MDGADLVNPSKSPMVVPALDPEVLKRMQNDPRMQMMRQKLELQTNGGGGCKCSAGEVLKKYAIGALIGIGIGVLAYYRFASGSKASGGALADGASAE